MMQLLLRNSGNFNLFRFRMPVCPGKLHGNTKFLLEIQLGIWNFRKIISQLFPWIVKRNSLRQNDRSAAFHITEQFFCMIGIVILLDHRKQDRIFPGIQVFQTIRRKRNPFFEFRKT